MKNIDLETLAQRFKEMGDKFLSIDEPVEMMSTVKPSCDTPGCHAGWARVLLGCESINTVHYQDIENRFWSGAYLLAQYLGFNDIRDMKYWAYNNPRLWDNELGWHMFYSVTAFGFRPGDRITTHDIGRHYHKVYDNIHAYLRNCSYEKQKKHDD